MLRYVRSTFMIMNLIRPVPKYFIDTGLNLRHQTVTKLYIV